MRKVVQYGASWCGPCVMMKGLLQKAEEEFVPEHSDLSFKYVDVESDEGVADCSKYKILAVPTIMCFYDDVLVSKTTGAMDYPTLQKMINNLLEYE